RKEDFAISVVGVAPADGLFGHTGGSAVELGPLLETVRHRPCPESSHLPAPGLWAGVERDSRGLGGHRLARRDPTAGARRGPGPSGHSPSAGRSEAPASDASARRRPARARARPG